jgi:hypothetical protein
MMPDLPEGSRFLLELNTAAEVHTSAGVRTNRARGELILEALADHPTSRGLRVVRFGLAATSVDAKRGPTGVITLTGTSGGGVVRPAARASHLRVQIDCTINYESLDRARGVVADHACYYIPVVEPAAASIEADVTIVGAELALTNGRLHVACAAGGFNEIHAVVVTIDKAILRPLGRIATRYRVGGPGEWQLLEDANTDPSVCVQTDSRQLTLQPVGFRTDETDPAPTGGTAAAQFAKAQAVWEKACITLQVNPIVLITDAALKTSSDLTAIRNAFTDPDPSVIEVFFVANSLPLIGGGSAGGIGLASCKPVIAEPNSGNPVLLAHELGHVLGLQHPSAISNSDDGTVMAPAGSAMLPGSELVTHFMCTNVANPALATLPTLCCLTHDIGNHYIRDYPLDTGQQPSDPPPAGMNHYAMSNVWNRLENVAGSANATTGPEHQQPIRFNADLTLRANFLFARVEQLVDLKVRNAIVKFYRKDPGSGGGAQNLHFIGEAPVAPGLAVGAPQYVSVPWTIPSGVPAHSCIFAVVRSDAEPEGDQSSLDWWQFENLARADNDWAQRNVDIQNFAASASYTSNRVESAVWFVHLPPRKHRPSSKMTLDLDARKAAGLVALDLEIVGRRKIKIEPGAGRRISIDVRNQGEPLVAVLHAVLPRGARPGRTFDIAVNPSMGRPVVGFMSAFRISSDREAVRQSLDIAAAAAADGANLTGLASADVLFCELKEQFACVPATLRGFARRIATLKEVFVAMEQDLDRTPIALRTAAPAALRELVGVIELFEAERASDVEVMARLRSFCHRLVAAASLIAGPKTEQLIGSTLFPARTRRPRSKGPATESLRRRRS